MPHKTVRKSARASVVAPKSAIPVPVWIGIVFFGFLLFSDTKGCTLPTTQKVTAVTYVYEKDDTAIPNPVLAALNKLNLKGIVATIFEQDTIDGSGATPEQYKVPLAAAKETGLPSAIGTGGGKVLKTVKDPKTEEQVLEIAL